MEKPSFHTKGTPTGPLQPGEYDRLKELATAKKKLSSK
jgi:hypothetical protein